MSNADHKLAIIVPAYRANFLAAALTSILSQTNQQFNLYVFDDASPDQIAHIVGGFASKRAISFHRFENNLGGISLVSHWHRCLAQITEPWVWLFSDDDLMDPDCVASFFNELNETKEGHDLYRFNTRSIDAKGCLLSENRPHPFLETGSDFLCARLEDNRTSTLQELIFARTMWTKIGGIPDFPLAWASDDAFTAKLGSERTIKTIAGPRISWRQSGLNISTELSPAAAKRKIIASQMMVRWTVDFFAKNPPSMGPLSKADWRRLTSTWFFRRVYYNHTYLNLKTCFEIDRFAQSMWEWPKGRATIQCFKTNYSLIKHRLRAWVRSCFASFKS